MTGRKVTERPGSCRLRRRVVPESCLGAPLARQTSSCSSSRCHPPPHCGKDRRTRAELRPKAGGAALVSGCAPRPHLVEEALPHAAVWRGWVALPGPGAGLGAHPLV